MPSHPPNAGPTPTELKVAAMDILKRYETYAERMTAVRDYLTAHPDVEARKFHGALNKAAFALSIMTSGA